MAMQAEPIEEARARENENRIRRALEAASEPLSSTEIRLDAHLTKNELQRTLSDLQDDESIRRFRDSDDQRIWLYELDTDSPVGSENGGESRGN